MSLLGRLLIFAGLAAAFPSPALACSCSNGVPIQRTHERYHERAVFRARVVQFLGQTEVFSGKQYSHRVLAVVRERYWGLPWYWPKVVVLDGGSLCNIVMANQEDYLVSGYRTHYGVLDVAFCSRTRPIETAQVDLRTLDGSHCAAPGGTIIGRVLQVGGQRYENSPARHTKLTFRDAFGKSYTAESDEAGIYELRHLAPGPYLLESPLGPGRYARGGGEVIIGLCTESTVFLDSYSITGRLIPGLGEDDGHVELIGPHGESPGVPFGLITPDGRFYFESVPPGEYYVRATIWGQGIYYPGVSSRERAVKIRVSNAIPGRSFDFHPDALPLVPIPVFVESPDPLHPIPVTLRAEDSARRIFKEHLSLTGIPSYVFGRRNERYGISAFGYGNKKENDPDRRSETVQATAKPGMSTIRLSLTMNQ